MELIDIGANLTHLSYQKDLQMVISRAINNGVTKIIITGTSLRGSIEAITLAKTKPGILYATVGIHPHDAKQCNDKTLDELQKLARDPQVVAIGECGLDYNRDFSPRPIQNRWFEEQVKLACTLKMPLFLHEREADQKLIEILSHYQSELPPTVIHCFTGNQDVLEKYLSMGFYIGITGWICDERRGQHLHSLVKKIPLDHLMIETDAPFLLPRNIPNRNYNNSRNEPAYLMYVVRKIAECIQKPVAEVAKATTATACQFFKLANSK